MAICHSWSNPEIIHLLEENKIQPEKEIEEVDETKSYLRKIKKNVISCEECYFKLIQFIHNEIGYLSNIDSCLYEAVKQSIKYNNFQLFDANLIKKYVFHELCK